MSEEGKILKISITKIDEYLKCIFQKAPPFISVRFCLAILAFFLFVIFFAQNISMSVAIVCMNFILFYFI